VSTSSVDEPRRQRVPGRLRSASVGAPVRGRRPVATLNLVFKRAAKTPASSGTSTTSGTSLGERDDAFGKGKATPKRSAAQAARRTNVVAGSRGRTTRGGKQPPQDLRARREALRRGDESVMSARDRGPVRRFARDFVDSRRSVVGLFIPVAFPVILLGYTRVGILTAISAFGLYFFVMAALVDSLRLTRRLRREIGIRFPGESTKGLGLYAIMRATQFRRMRIPGVRVARGTKL
jgi:hypothetical protein